MLKALVNGVNLSYQQFGDGPDVVMIHGLAANRAFWYLPIAQKLHSYQVTLYDLRGHGYSDFPPHGYTIADMARDLYELLDYLHIPQATLIGHSFGGLVALYLALHSPERVNRLILADSRIYAFQPIQQISDSLHRSPIEQMLLADSNVDWNNEPHLGLRLLEEIAKDRWQETRREKYKDFIPFSGKRGSAKTANQWLRLLDTTTARHDLVDMVGLTAEKISQLTQPLLAVYGERSGCLPSCHQLKDVVPTCKAVIAPDLGHFHPVTNPAFFLNALTTFLDANQ